MKKLTLFLTALLTGALAFGALTSQDKAFIPETNILSNPGWEGGKGGWTGSGGTYDVVTSAANVGEGLTAGTFTPSGAQNLRSNLVSVPNAIKGADCLGQLYYKGGDSNYTLKVLDNSSNVLASQSMVAQTNYGPVSLNFVCPTSGSIRLSLEASGAATQIYLDKAFLGKALNILQVSQALRFGSINHAATANCLWSNSAATFTAYSADSDCPVPAGSDLTGDAQAPSTKIPAIKFASIPPGRYLVVASGMFYQSSAGQTCSWRFHDGTNALKGVASVSGGAGNSGTGVVVGEIDYTTAQSNVTIQIQEESLGSGTCQVILDTSITSASLLISVYKYPSYNEQAYKPDQVAWHVDATISGANPSLGTSDQASFTGIEDSGLSIAANTGSLSVQIPCSSTNGSTGSTCAVGNESVGVVFNIPRAGSVLACASFAWKSDVAAAGSADITFQIVETPNAAQTISQEGNSRVNQSANNNGSASVTTLPNRVCGKFNFSSAGQKTLRLFYEQDLTATVNSNVVLADQLAAQGQRDIHWEVYPIDTVVPAPLLVNSVVSPSSGIERITRSYITNSGSCAISTQSGSWLSSVSDPGAGRCTLSIAAGTFSAAPTCTCSVVGATSSYCQIESGATSTSLTTLVSNDAGAALDNDFNIVCIGPR